MMMSFKVKVTKGVGIARETAYIEREFDNERIARQAAFQAVKWQEGARAAVEDHVGPFVEYTFNRGLVSCRSLITGE
jgi:hypothetical protein